MMNFKNLTIVGTSHIASQSVQEVSRAIKEVEPQIVALELDPARFQALVSRRKRRISFWELPKIGLTGYLFGLIGGYIQKKLGRIVGVVPGAEMVTAIKIAQEKRLKIALVDQAIEVTLKRFSQAFSWREKLRLIADLGKGIFFRKRELRKYGLENFDLAKVPEKELIKKLIKEFRKRYPSLYRVLVEERNKVIGENLYNLIKKNPEVKIVAVMGAGHEEEVRDILKHKNKQQPLKNPRTFWSYSERHK